MVVAGAVLASDVVAFDRRRCLLTGATGILGSEILAQLLRANVLVTVLIRDTPAASAEARLRAVLAHGGVDDWRQNVELLRGDVLELHRLTPLERERLGDLTDVVHCAALTAFDPNLAEALGRVNIQGAASLLEHFSGTRAVFHHVSTGYVAGTFGRPFSEHMLDVGQSFRNPYERSKFEAERQLRQRARELGLTLRIYRPSIVVGASDSGRIASFTSVYPFLRLSLSPFAERVRIQGRPETPLNLVPVDWVANAIVFLMGTAPSTEVFHLTNPHPPDVQQLTTWSRAYAPSCRVEIHPELDQPTRIERLLQHQLRHYAPYLSAGPRFDSGQTQALLPETLRCPRLGDAHYSGWLRYAEARSWRDLRA